MPPSGQAGTPERVSGVITDVGDDAFVLETGDGSDLRLHMSADALSNLNLDTCNTADVVYHQDAGLLLADSVPVTGTSTSGDCTPTEDVTGTIASVSGQGLTVTTESGTMTFSADPSVTDGFQTGDLVDITYTQGSDGSLTASDVQYVEENASGTVTAVQGTNLTITDGETNQSETFVADATHGVQIDAQTFAGIATGDQVDVTYHRSAGHLIADTVCDNGTSGDSRPFGERAAHGVVHRCGARCSGPAGPGGALELRIANAALPVYFRRFHPDRFNPVTHLILPLLGAAAIGYPLSELVKPGRPARSTTTC